MQKKRPHNALPEEMIEAIKKLSKEGVSNADIAKQFGLNRSTISRHSLNKRKTVNDEQKATVVRMFKSGKERYEIAEFLGFSESLIYRLTRDVKRTKLTSTPKPLPPKKRKTEVRKEDTEDMRKFSRKDPLAGRVKIEIKPGLWAYIKNDEKFNERLERQKQLHLNK